MIRFTLAVVVGCTGLMSCASPSGRTSDEMPGRIETRRLSPDEMRATYRGTDGQTREAVQRAMLTALLQEAKRTGFTTYEVVEAGSWSDPGDPAAFSGARPSSLSFRMPAGVGVEGRILMARMTIRVGQGAASACAGRLACDAGSVAERLAALESLQQDLQR